MASKLKGKIIKILPSKVHAQIQILWKNTPLSVIVTKASCEEMGLREGDFLYVLVKGTDVMLAKSFSGKLSARNRVEGTVQHIVHGDVLSKVAFESQGDLLYAIITNMSLKEMDIGEGDKVTAIVKSTELILMKGEE
ncbi:MAG: TOBE domain-containing protein [Candidatus Kuenenia sp.]|nr:TOBE domain-containing protein [Candidatus Kuenenia hertensis]